MVFTCESFVVNSAGDCFMQVAQVAAKTLGIPIEMIKIKPSNSLTNPNTQATGGSMTSELNCLVSSSS